MTLREFLLDRIAEDEAEVADWPVDGPWGLFAPDLMWTDTLGRPIYAPRARVLAECEVKRGIIGAAGTFQSALDHKRGQFGETWRLEEVFLRALAAVYADHEDYRDEWLP